MKINKIIILVLFIAAGSCGQATKNQTAESDEAPFSIAEKDSVVFDDETFRKYEHGFTADSVGYKTQLFTKGKAKYQLHFFISKNPKFDHQECFMIDSIPLGKGMYSLIISAWEIDTDYDFVYRAWLVNYLADNQYIDSRIIYKNESVGENNKKIYSKLYLSEKRLVIFNNDWYDGEDNYFEVPVIIHQDGRFEEFPDMPFSKNTIAISNCNSNGFWGKFPLKQKWTIIRFSENKIKTIETTQNGFDHFQYESTLIDLQQEEYFDVAFKGEYAKKDIEIVKIKAEDNEEIADLVKQNLPQELDSLQADFKNIRLFPFVVNEKTFWVVYYVYNVKDNYYYAECTAVLGVTPQMQVVLLSEHKIHEEVYFLRLKDKFLLYVVNNVIGEGEYIETMIYQMDTDFHKIFDDWSNYCD
jgi:hypothetical protein